MPSSPRPPPSKPLAMPSPIDPDRIALGVQQPWAELIVRGIKTIEVRSTSARVRGRIYVYASRRPSALPDARVAADRHDLEIGTLPSGLIVGSAVLTESRPARPADAEEACIGPMVLAGRFAWRLTDAERFEVPLPVRFLPYGVWFYPFRERGGSHGLIPAEPAC